MRVIIGVVDVHELGELNEEVLPVFERHLKGLEGLGGHAVPPR